MTSNFGFGLGLRSPHIQQFLHERPKDVQWLEILSDNYLNAHGGYHAMLDDLRQDYPMLMHGVALSIGTTDPLDEAYLTGLRDIAQRLEIPFISDHLCFTGIGNEFSHDLLPIPYTEEALQHLIPRIHHVQEVTAKPLVLENASTYLEFDGNTLHEAEFFSALHQATGCGILLDINNVYVSSTNHGWNPQTYIDAIPAASIMQYHLAGHTDCGDHLIDTHDAAVSDAVWALYRYTLGQKGPRSTLLEWDANIPELSVLQAELQKARQQVAA